MQVDGLDEELHGAVLHRGGDRVHVVVRGHHDEWDVNSLYARAREQLNVLEARVAGLEALQSAELDALQNTESNATPNMTGK